MKTNSLYLLIFFFIFFLPACFKDEKKEESNLLQKESAAPHSAPLCSPELIQESQNRLSSVENKIKIQDFPHGFFRYEKAEALVQWNEKSVLIVEEKIEETEKGFVQRPPRVICKSEAFQVSSRKDFSLTGLDEFVVNAEGVHFLDRNFLFKAEIQDLAFEFLKGRQGFFKEVSLLESFLSDPLKNKKGSLQWNQINSHSYSLLITLSSSAEEKVILKISYKRQ